MIEDILTDPTSKALTKSLEGVSKRQRALSTNIANAETPGYIRQEVEFHGALAAAVEEAGEGGLPEAETIDGIEPRQVFDLSKPLNADGNNVDIEHEMAELARNSLEFESSSRMLSLKIRMLRSAISEGRK